MMFDKLLSVMNEGGTVDFLTVIDSSSAELIGQMLIMYSDGRVDSLMDDDITEKITEKITENLRTTTWIKPITFSVEDEQGGTSRIFWDRIEKTFRAVVFGGGHISQPLVQLLSLLDFDVTIVDDRPEFANHARFPGAKRVICDSFRRVLQELTIGEDTAVIIVTRGHQYDLECLRATIGSGARYLGMIGSKKRIREMIHVFREAGVNEELLKQLRAPIGLDIKAETPTEIAVSIAAEVVSVFRGGSGRPLSGYAEVF
ncbi:MAG: hypothetical protein H6Q75_925 [Firmicutes bacterium]|nr:hypothetical protein [Bacillota bacterium]